MCIEEEPFVNAIVSDNSNKKRVMADMADTISDYETCRRPLKLLN